MASTKTVKTVKTVKTAAKVKVAGKTPTAAAAKKLADKVQAAEVKVEVRIKEAPGSIRAVMSLPPPTGQPPKPPGKAQRIADSAVTRYKTVEKRTVAA